MLEKEEEDFANQIRKQKSFLQNVFREKEELAQLCVNQTAKLSKLESERMEWQRKIIPWKIDSHIAECPIQLPHGQSIAEHWI